MNNTLQSALDRVWTFRRKYEKWWTTPDVLDAIRFAGAEAYEAIDAKLRGNQTYARNNERNQKILDELADCAMMLLTALGPDYEFRPVNVSYSNPSEEYLDWIAGDVGAALASYCRWRAISRKHGRDANRHIYEEGILFALGFIFHYPGMDLLPMLDARLERIYQKHIAKERKPLFWGEKAEWLRANGYAFTLKALEDAGDGLLYLAATGYDYRAYGATISEVIEKIYALVRKDE